MTLEKHFEKCTLFLKKWNYFLELEPLRKYPDYCPENIRPWIDELSQKDLNQIVNLENTYSIETQFSDFTDLLHEIRSLIHFPKYQNTKLETPLISNKIKMKKEHEIKQIAAILDNVDQINIIDIGGGAGHLSENLIHQQDRFSYCIDQDEKLQANGIKRIHENNQKNLEKIEFKTLYFNDHTQSIGRKIYPKNYVLGLHACGDLTPAILNFATKTKAEHLLSVGCCYQKLTDQYNLSKLAKKHNLQLTPNAFNLAARSHTHLTRESLELKIKIREYRYHLHCYLYELGHHKFIPTGKTRIPDYAKMFGEYAKKYAKELIVSSENAQNFYNEFSTNKTVLGIIYTDLFRELFGRVIESYIVLDRALFLKDNGHQVMIQEIFDKKLSPRNLAIMAQKLNEF